MKGIMLKDLYDNFCIPKNAASFVFAALIILPAGLLFRSAEYYTLFIGVITPLLGACAVESSTEQDEAANFNKLMITFPVTKAEIVLSKYLLGLIFILASNLIALICTMVQVYIHHTVRLAEVARMWGIGLSVSLLCLSVIYIGYFLLGKRWGTIFFIVIVSMIGALFGALRSLYGIEIFLNCSPLLVFGLLAAGAVTVALSCLASIGIYKKKYS